MASQIGIRHHDPRTSTAVDLLLKDPTRTVPEAMRAAGFSIEESRDRTKQMWVRRRIPPKRPKKEPSSLIIVPHTQSDLPDPEPDSAAAAAAAAAVGGGGGGAHASSKTASEVRIVSERGSEADWSSSNGGGGGDDNKYVADELLECCELNEYWKHGSKSEVAAEWISDNNLGEVVDDEYECELQDWISCHRDDNIGGQGGHKPVDRKYLEQSVQILYSLAGIIVTGGISGSSERKVLVHPDYITVANVIVRKLSTTSLALGLEDTQQDLSATFIQAGSSIYTDHDEGEETKKMYAAMHAFAQIAYAMCLRGNGPRLPDFLPRPDVTTSGPRMSTAAHRNREDAGCDDAEEEIMDMIRKQYRVDESDDINASGFISAMVDAGIPLPLRRFISDLLGDEHGEMIRPEHAFASFQDVLSDLKQMTIYPDRFLHGSYSDRWKIVFDDKLYGREDEMEALMIAADRVTRVRDDGRLDDRQCRLAGKKSEVVMVSGHSGAGKSRLVKLAGACLEKRGWLVLRCKFDRIANPQPLSVLTHSLDAYLRSLALCPKHGIRRCATSSSLSSMECSCFGRSQGVRARLNNLIHPRGLEMLAKYIPSLKLLMDVVSPSDAPELNESMMTSLFCKLLQALSSKQTPILFFLDDLQWADTLSLTLFTELVKEASPDLNSSAPESKLSGSRYDNLDEEAYIMFVGSYRKNEMESNHLLATILDKFRGDSSISMVDISLSGLSHESLNEMLSDTLSLPMRRVTPLTVLVIQKTDGHPLHVTEFIQALTANNLLTHSFSRGWEWDADSIDIFPITDSVAELYSYKLRRLPGDILRGIQILSCFGFQVDQQVLDFVADYDGIDSVDMNAALHIATSEGLIERAGPLISFTHDMILNAAIETIREDDLIPLLRKLITVLIKEASAAGFLDSVLFVAVDLINRVGSEFTTDPKDRGLFAELNLHAGRTAIAVPDFAGAATYAENGISFLSDTCWQTQYELCIRLYEISVLSLFPSLTGDRSKLMHRMKDVFEHARDFSDKFKTHMIWVQLLAASDLSRAIEECIIALVQLGEPLDFTNLDHNRVCSELVKQNEQVKPSEFLAAKRLVDLDKVRAMKVMSLLLHLYQSRKNSFAAFVSCKMVELSINYGTCEESVHGVAAFASAMKHILGLIDEASTWGRTSLLLLKSFGEKPTLIPLVYAEVYGSDLLIAEPIQSFLEPLSQCVRFAVETGNNEFSFLGSVYYLLKSFGSGKNIRVLIDEVFITVRHLGNHLGNDSTFKTPSYDLFLQFFFSPLYNVFTEFEGDALAKDAPFPFDQVQLSDNYSVLNAAIDLERFNFVLVIIMVQTPYEFMSRNMEKALQLSNMFFEHFLGGDNQTTMLSGSVPNVFYLGLINFYFMRQRGEDQYKVRGEKALRKLEGWLAYSEWNFKQLKLLVEAEFHYSMKNLSMAATCYEASIKAAHDHKFIHEEAIANELAGYFFLEDGQLEKSLSFFKQSSACYRAWGAFFVARRVECFIEKEFSTGVTRRENDS